MTAARSGSVAVVRALIAAGADVDAAAAGGQTALMWAAAEGHPRVVSVLAEVGTDIDARTAVLTRPGRTVVREARVLSRFEAVNPASPAPGRGPGPAAARGRVHAPALRVSWPATRSRWESFSRPGPTSTTRAPTG